MKNLIATLVSLLMLGIAGKSLAQDNPTNIWVLWTCEGGSEFGPVPTGNRKAVVQFDYPWSGYRSAEYLVPISPIGYGWISLGVFGPGRHTVEFDYQNPQIPGFVYENSFMTGIRFIDSVGNISPSTMIFVTTEPSPVLENVVTNNGNNIEIVVSTYPVNGQNWGQVETCSDFHTIVTTEAVSEDGNIVFRDTTWCTPGQQVNETLNFEYFGDVTRLCVASTMKRIGGNSSLVLDHEITSSETSCLTVGSVNTGVESFDNQSIAITYPNPFGDNLTIEVGPGAGWKILNTLGQERITGVGTKTIDTDALTRGAYIFLTDGGYATKIIKE